jgi:hypothetical protein
MFHFYTILASYVDIRSCVIPHGLICRRQRLGPDLKLAMEWLNDCVTNHPECVLGKKNTSPSRVLEINSDSSAAGPTTRLIDTDGTFEPYLAFSHCWGLLHTLCTTVTNYQ